MSTDPALLDEISAENPVPPSRATLRRQHVVDIARTLFAEHGFHATGIAQIAARSGVKVGQIYRDFASKEDIVAALVAADLSAFLDKDALEAAITAQDRAGARAWIADLVLRKADPQHAPLLPEIFAEASRNDRIADLLRQTDTQIRGCVLRALEVFNGCPDRAECRNAVADLILTLMTGLCSRQMAQVSSACPDMAQRIFAVIDREAATLVKDDRCVVID